MFWRPPKNLDEESIGEATLNIEEEVKAPKPIAEGRHDSPPPSVIDGVFVNQNSRANRNQGCN